MITKTIQLDESVAELRRPAYGRLLSLDALRGFDMFWIIGGQEIIKGLAQVFPGKLSEIAVGQLEHVRWQGLHFYDVIWPLFMFMVGVSLSFSLARRKLSGATHKALVPSRPEACPDSIRARNDGSGQSAAIRSGHASSLL